MPKRKSTPKESDIPETDPMMEDQDYGGEYSGESEDYAGTPEAEGEYMEAPPGEDYPGEANPDGGDPSPDWGYGDGGDYPAGDDPFPGGDDFPSEDSPSESGESPSEESAAWGEAPTSAESAEWDNDPGETGEAEDPEYAALLQEMSESGLSATPDDGAEPLVLEDTDGYAEAQPSMEPESEVPDVEAEPNVPGLEEAAGYTGDGSRERAPRRRRAAPARPQPAQRNDRVLTIDARDEVQTEAEREAILWHEIQNAHWTRRILTGTLDGVEQTESGMTVAAVSYKGFRVAIPVKEMMLYAGRMPSGPEYMELMNRMRRILTARLGSEIDFIVMGHENRSRSVVGSRRAAMYRKRQNFYLDTNELGQPMIYEGRVVQARVVAVSEKMIRVEIFGVECAIVARNLSDSWLGNAADHYSVGDRILVRILNVSGTSVEDLAVSADVRSVNSSSALDALKKCVPQGRYAGKITDIRGGVVFIRLNNGANAIAHSCYDRRTPGKRDDVSFSVTRLDEEQGVAIGIITRIIKQNL